MFKSELIERIAAENPHLYHRDVANIVNAILDTITTALAQGDRVELRDFGVFAVKTRDARTGRNPRNGSEVPVSEKVFPTFKTSRDMHHRLNPSEE
jgi:integration host factor subunit beta